MRWPVIVGALAAGGIAGAAPEPVLLAASEQQAPSIYPPPVDEPPLPPEEQLEPDVHDPPDYPIKRKAPKLAEIDGAVLPNEFTDDPVLGRAERVVGEGVKGMIAFTFDDGPGPDTTPSVLAALKKYDIPASFFIVTRHFRHPRAHYVAAAEALLAQELADGHVVGSHGHMHERLLGAGPKELDREIDASLKMLSTHAQRPIGMFRAPFGKINYLGRKRLKTLGLTEVFWSIDPRDWDADPGDEWYMRGEISRAIANAGGGVIVLHDSKPVTASIIAGVFDDLEAANCKKLATGLEPIYPVSIHYFLRDDGDVPRPVPPEVAARTEAYKEALPGRCDARARAKRKAKAKSAAK